MPRPCTNFVWEVPLPSMDSFKLLVGEKGTYVEFRPLLTLVPSLKDREAQIIEATKVSRNLLKGRRLLTSSGIVERMEDPACYVPTDAFVREALYKRHTKESSQVISSLLNLIFQHITQAYRALTECRVCSSSRLQTEAYSDSIHSKLIQAGFDDVVLDFIGRRLKELQWSIQRNSSEIPIYGLEFESGFILAPTYYNKSYVGFYMSVHQIKSVLHKILRNTAVATELLNSIFGLRSMHDALKETSALRRKYYTYCPDIGHHLFHSEVILEAFCKSADPAAQTFLSLLKRTQEECILHQALFIEVLGAHPTEETKEMKQKKPTKREDQLTYSVG